MCKLYVYVYMHVQLVLVYYIVYFVRVILATCQVTGGEETKTGKAGRDTASQVRSKDQATTDRPLLI